MEIQSNTHGRGVYATRPYKKGALIELCQLIILNETDRKKIDQTSLYNYYFSWGENDKQAAIALGYGSLYNHSYSPNAVYEKDLAINKIRFTAIREILSGDEITINYNGDPNSMKKLWFNVVDS